MATQNMKRFGIPTALVVGGVTAGSLFAPIGLAAAQEADTDTEPDTTVESDAAESETGEDTERDGRRSDRRAAKAEALTEALGLTIDEIKAGFSEGNSIADLAEAQGVSTDDVKAALVAAANERIDAAVESGRLDEAEADEKRAELDERIDQMITADPSEFQGRRGNGNRGGHGKSGFASEVVTETLGLTSSVDDLAAAMVDAASERIDAAVEEGKIDADAADEKKAELEERIDDVLNGELSEREGRRGHRGNRGDRSGDTAETAVEDVEDAGLSA
jgi:ribosomal protein S20